MEFIIRFFRDGGWIMVPIGTLCLLGMLCIVERLYMILVAYQSNGAALMQKIHRLVMENNIQEAIKVCNSGKNGAVNKVLKAALMNADRPFDEIQDHVEVATRGVVPKLHQRMPYLSTIGNSATLCGLLGTVAGLIETFMAVGAVEGSQKAVLLSNGISIALNSTVFGLVVAIPCMMVYGFLLNRITGIIDDIEYYSGQLLIMLRTGGEYFENFKDDEEPTTTKQIPKKIEGKKVS